MHRCNQTGEGMANEKNLKPAKTHSEAVRRGAKGGSKSGEERRKKADFRKSLNNALMSEYKIKGKKGPVLGVDAVIDSLMRVAMDPDNKNSVAAINTMLRMSGQDKPLIDQKEQRARIEQIKVMIDKNRMEIAKKMDPAEVEDDGLMDALKGMIEDDWKDSSGVQVQNNVTETANGSELVDE